MDDPLTGLPRTSPQQASAKSSGGRQRIISSCLTCRRRKVRCDHVHPVCGACTRGNHICTYATDIASGSGAGRVSKSSLAGVSRGARGGDVQARLDRLELLLERAVNGPPPKQRQPSRNEEDHAKSERELSKLSPSSTSQTSQAGMSFDDNDGTLLVDGEHSQFVSSLHYALLADEIQDIKALLGEESDEGHELPTRNNLVHLLSLGLAKISITLESLLPETQDHRDALLDAFFSNVDPMVRVTHTPTLKRKFASYVSDVHPMAFAVFYTAVYSLPPAVVQSRFGETKEALCDHFELGLEIGLARGNYLTTQNLELLQAFVLWLTCITKEEDMGKAWTLIGIAIRIALSQGLHRDPSLFPSGSWDAVTIETRRRVWHQICHLEFRAAECKGQEPSIDEDDYTTMLPRNIEDEELVEGSSPGQAPYDEERFTSITFQLVRFVGMSALRNIVKRTYRLERRMMESGLRGVSGPDPAYELQTMFDDIKKSADIMHEENHRKYLRFCSPDVPLERLTLGLASFLEWRLYLLFWLRMPRAYRDVVFSDEIRKSIFEKSLNCIETLNGASVDSNASKFQWHIGGHAAFQAIMHVLSELRNPLFQTPHRARALRAIQLSRQLKENNTTKPWQAVKSMIDRVISQNLYSADEPTEDTSTQGTVPGACRTPPPSTSRLNPPAPAQVASFPTQPLMTEPAAPLAPMPQEPIQVNWDDLNFDNIVSGGQGLTEVPEFDFGFWGDPVNFGSEPLQYPLDGGYAWPWTT